MDRLVAANSVPLIQADFPPVLGTPQYATDGNAGLGIPATKWPASAFNAIQEELMSFLTAAGITPDRNNYAQVLAAVKKLIQTQQGPANYNVTGGTAGALTVTLDPPLLAHVPGMPIRFRPHVAPLGGASLNPGPGAKTLKRSSGVPVLPGDLGPGNVYTAVYDATLNCYLVLELIPLDIIGMAQYPAVSVPNNGTPTFIANVGGPANTNFATFLVRGDNGASSFYSAIVNAQAFAPGALPQAANSNGGTPGTWAFSMSGTAMYLSITGGAGGFNNVRATQLAG